MLRNISHLNLARIPRLISSSHLQKTSRCSRGKATRSSSKKSYPYSKKMSLTKKKTIEKLKMKKMAVRVHLSGRNLSRKFNHLWRLPKSCSPQKKRRKTKTKTKGKLARRMMELLSEVK